MRRQTQLSAHDMKTMTPHNPPLTNVTIDVTTDPQTNVAIVQPIAAICVREVYDQSVLQFTINHKICFALPRYTSRVIHRSKFLTFLLISLKRQEYYIRFWFVHSVWRNTRADSFHDVRIITATDEQQVCMRCHMLMGMATSHFNSEALPSDNKPRWRHLC